MFLLNLCSYWSCCSYWFSIPTVPSGPLFLLILLFLPILCSYWSSVPTVPSEPPFLLILLFLLILCTYWSYCSFWPSVRSYCSCWSSVPTDPTKILPILCFYPSSVPTVPVFLLILFSCWSYWPCVPTVYPHSNYFPMTSVRSSYTSHEPISAYGLNWAWVAHMGISTVEWLHFRRRTFHVPNLMHQ